MPRARWTRWIGIILAGIAAAVLLAVVALWLFVDVNRYKPSLESAASRATGLTVRIGGAMRVVFFPPFGLSVSDVRIGRGGHDVLRIKEATAGLRLFPLLWGTARLRTLEITRPALVVRRTGRGPFDWNRYVSGPLRKARQALPGAFDRIERIAVSGGSISYEAAGSGSPSGARDVSLALRQIAFPETVTDPLRTVSFRGVGKAARATLGGVEVTGITFAVRAKDGNYELAPVAFTVFGGPGEASGWLSVTEKTPLAHVAVSLPNVRADDLAAVGGGERGPLDGTLAFSASLFAKGEEPGTMAGTMSGDISWEGSNLTVHGFDPDALLSGPARNGISVARVAALLLPGPPFLGAARSLSGLLGAPAEDQEQGRLETLVSRWTAKDGVFTARDAAFATKTHRVALAGGIDVPRQRFDGLVAALVDASGCAAAKAAIEGPFRQPRIAKASPAAGRISPGGASPSRPAKPVAETGCSVFYAGAVSPPQ